MTRNYLLTSPDALGTDRILQYYCARNEFGFDYCEAMQGMEACTKYILARFPLEGILIIGGEAFADNGETVRLKDAGDLCSADPETLSAFDLYRYRIAQYIDEQSREQQAYDALLPEEERGKLIGFISSFMEQHSERETKRLNRFFDELACSRQLYEKFREALFDAFPKIRKDPRLTMKWVRNYLYTQLKPSAKLENLPANENVCARYVPVDMLAKREYWFGDVLDVNQDVLDGKDEINLFVSLGSDSAVDPHIVLNMLDILVSTPGSNVHLKKIYNVNEPAGNLAGEIEDRTAVSLTTNLVAAAHAFLNYSKTDMLVDFWENSGARNDRISSLIYAARHVDTGISMCNIGELQTGIQQLRRMLRDERSWAEAGEYGPLFGVLSGCILADYGPMMEGDGEVPFIELIKWAYRHQLYQQVLTLIESNAPTMLVNSGIFYYCDDESHVEGIRNILVQKRMELKPYEYFKMDDIDHYFIKNYDRDGVKSGDAKGEDRNLAYAAMRARSIENPVPGKINGHTACDSIETVQNVLYSYFNLGSVRNMISHADAGAMAERRLVVAENDISYAMGIMKQSIEFFIMSYEKAMEEVRDKNPRIVAISPDDVRNAANRMRYDRNREARQAAPRREP